MCIYDKLVILADFNRDCSIFKWSFVCLYMIRAANHIEAWQE